MTLTDLAAHFDKLADDAIRHHMQSHRRIAPCDQKILAARIDTWRRAAAITRNAAKPDKPILIEGNGRRVR